MDIGYKEVIQLNVDDVDFVEQSIKLKPTHKRTNKTIFFDGETTFILHALAQGENIT
jgi:hypothetical protein